MIEPVGGSLPYSRSHHDFLSALVEIALLSNIALFTDLENVE